MELTAIPYTIKLDLECDGCCHGSLVRLPDGVEASFNHTEGLLVLLEGIGGRRWWQENRGLSLRQSGTFLFNCVRFFRA